MLGVETVIRESETDNLLPCHLSDPQEMGLVVVPHDGAYHSRIHDFFTSCEFHSFGLGVEVDFLPGVGISIVWVMKVARVSDTNTLVVTGIVEEFLSILSIFLQLNAIKGGVKL